MKSTLPTKQRRPALCLVTSPVVCLPTMMAQIALLEYFEWSQSVAPNKASGALVWVCTPHDGVEGSTPRRG